MTPPTQIKDRPSPLQDEIISFVFRQKALTGEPPTLRDIKAHFEFPNSNTVRYHLNKMVGLRYLEASLVVRIYERGREGSASGHGCGKHRRQGSCPERAKKIAHLLLTDTHAVDRLARYFANGVEL